jgi:hypothetical protein|tara:strand:- start:1757 stop:1942 length:186 start_codon:yes stop_codon:yes gene_type:complete
MTKEQILDELLDDSIHVIQSRLWTLLQKHKMVGEELNKLDKELINDVIDEFINKPTDKYHF